MKGPKKIVLFSLWFILSGKTGFSQQKIEQWSRFEIRLSNHSHKNSFADNYLSATFTHKDTTITISGFYDGDNQYCIRFMPEKTGIWKYRTHSTLSPLNNKKGEFECVKASLKNHGIVRVSQTFHFKYADSAAFFPIGTTAYAWTHMADDIQEETLKSLQNSGFNKIRMCVFPKNYELVKEEPSIYPYAIREIKKDAKGNEIRIWDFNRFNPLFFQKLEKRIDDLRNLGIEADLILFHPYDKGRWGFDEMPMEANLNYIRYLVARLASFRNVWWSLANEYDYVKSKTERDWEVLLKAVAKADPYHHLCSIHGSTAQYFNYWLPEITHASIQDESPVINRGGASMVRNIYKKPIIFDEVGYEGNLKSRWGRYSAEEMNHLIWMGLIGGTYVTHGESFMFKDNRDTIFWAKGGKFKGTSWKRIAFMRKILEETGTLEMADVSRDFKTATNGKGTYIIYFGKEIPEQWIFDLPHKNANYVRPTPGTKYKVEILDTWNMTISTSNITFEATEPDDYRILDKEKQKISLPLKPYIALRITEINSE